MAEIRALEGPHHRLFSENDVEHVGAAFPSLLADIASAGTESPRQLFTAWRDGELAGCCWGRRREQTLMGMRMRKRVAAFEISARVVVDPHVGPQEPGEILGVLLESMLDTQRDCPLFNSPRRYVRRRGQREQSPKTSLLPKDSVRTRTKVHS